MNILYIEHYAGSLDMGMEFRPYYLSREWVKKGHTVSIIAADFSHLRSENPEISKDFELMDIDGIRYFFVKTAKYSGNGGKRALTMFQFASKLWRKAKMISKMMQPDIVISSSTYPLDTYPARRIACLSNCRVIHEVHDLWPLTLIEVGGMSAKHPFVRLLQRAENDAYEKSDAIVSLLPFADVYMREHGMEQEKFNYVPNGVVLEDWEKSEPLPKEHDDVIKKLKKKGNTIACYFGGHAKSNKLDFLLDVSKGFADEKITLCMVGNGAEKERLQKRKEDEHLDNVVFLPPVSKKSIPTLLKDIDLICICGDKNNLYKYGVCINKVYDSMMAAKPVAIAMDAPNDDVADSGCGISVPAGDVEAMVDAIKKISRMSPREREDMGRKGSSMVREKYEYSHLADRFLDIIREVSRSGKGLMTEVIAEGKDDFDLNP